MAQDVFRIGGIRRLADNGPGQFDGGVGRQHQALRQAALLDQLPAVFRLGARDAFNVGFGYLSGVRRFVDVGIHAGRIPKVERIELNANLRQQLAPPWAARREIEPWNLGDDGHRV